MLRRNTNRSEVNPVPAFPFPKQNLSKPMMWRLLSSKKKQSLHHIAVHHAGELMKPERTLYTYTNNELFTARNVDMPHTIRIRPRKNVFSKLKVDKSCRIGRDFHVLKYTWLNIRMFPSDSLIL